MKYIVYQLLALSMALCVPSCVRQEGAGNGLARVRVSVTAESGTRSAWNGSEAGVSKVQVAAYRTSDGTLAGFSSESDLLLPTDENYRFYSLVNCPDVDFPAREKDLPAVRLDISGMETFPDGLPMAGVDVVQVRGFRQDITLNVKRLVARLDFSFVDRDALGFSPSYIKIRQAAADVAPWAESTPTSTCDGDYATEAELAGFSARLYVPENLQGSYPDIEFQQERVPSALGSAAGLCTYLEVGMDFPEGSAIISNPDRSSSRCDVIYRLFLGNNMPDNFDIMRNISFRVTLSATEAALMDGGMDWSIDSDLGFGGEDVVAALPWHETEGPMVSDQSPFVPASVTVIDSIPGTSTVTVPAGMRFADIFIVSGGESGAWANTGVVMGGKGGCVWWTSVRVQEGMEFECTVGNGGSSSTAGNIAGGISSVVTPFATYRADDDSNYNTGRRRTSSMPAPDGVANPFDSADTGLYGASGAGAAGYSKVSQNPGKTGGGMANTKLSTGSGGSFFGAGGGGAYRVASGAGYNGVIIIYFRPY